MSYQSRSTNPYIMEKKLNECVGGGGFDPSVLEEMQADISVLGSENATMAQDIIDIKGSLNSINDKLSVTDVSSGFYVDTSIVTATIVAYKYGKIITVYVYYTPKVNISSSNPFLFSNTYDMASHILGTGTGGEYYIGPANHKIDVRPSGTRSANTQYYMYFTFITTTA